MTPAAEAVAHVRAGFEAGLLSSLPLRRAQLDALDRMLEAHRGEIVEALRRDLAKPAFETETAELAALRGEIGLARRKLARWSADQRLPLPTWARPARARTVAQPVGVVLVVAPWNIPVALLLAPLVSALAAGDAVVLKPSELAPATSALLARVLPLHLDPRVVAVVEGGADVVHEAIAAGVDHVHFTGSARVGALVAEAAGRHLTPVTLELGGKNPAIVAADADLRAAARQLVWGRCVNAGQTCLAPDYVLVERSVERRLVAELAAAVRGFWGPTPSTHPDLGRIAGDAHVARLARLIEDRGTAELVVGGQVDADTRFVAPTVLAGVDPAAPIMAQEVFGPILSVLAVDDVAEAVRFVEARPAPLTLYLFSRSRPTARHVARSTRSGSLCVNATMVHFATGTPFGGVGASGYGAGHGRAGFDALTHRKPVLQRAPRPDWGLLYPPSGRLKSWLVRRLV